jgi:uncharacterized membrane protein YgcG
MRYMKYFVAGVLVFGSLLILHVPSASADVNDFVINDFSGDYTLTNADKQGELHIVEKIKLTFSDYNHGIVRALPNSYKDHRLQLHVTSVTSDTNAPSQYSTYQSNGNTVLKIGSPSSTVTGAQEYTIDYTVDNVIGFYDTYDELYWDINGDQWQQSFEHVSANFHLPEVAQLATHQPICYTGAYGSTAQNCNVTKNAMGPQIETTTRLDANQTLSVVTGFTKGYFVPATTLDRIKEYISTVQLLEILVPFFLIGGGSFYYWLTRGRDSTGTGIIIPQYDAPDGLKPIEVGEIVDFKVDNRDITATIIGLAIKKYIRIIETKKNKLIGADTLSYSLIILNADLTALDAYELKLMNTLFPSAQIGDTFDLSKSTSKLYTVAQSISKTVSDDLTTRGYFRSSPLSAGGSQIGIAVTSIFGLFFVGKYIGWALSVGIISGMALLALFGKFAAARTVKGVAAREHILGLKLYLEVAEKDRLEKLQGPNAAYAASAEPVKTVELFEKLLPYAMALGVEQGWAKQFESLYTAAPDWYQGNWSTFNAVYLASSLSTSMGQAVNSSFSAPRSSSTSGFGGGGGFSGGGGGGGGGGGW